MNTALVFESKSNDDVGLFAHKSVIKSTIVMTVMWKNTFSYTRMLKNFLASSNHLKNTAEFYFRIHRKRK